MSLREITVKITAGGSDEFAFRGNYIRAKLAPYTLQIENVESGGRDTFTMVEGEEAIFSDNFERLRITNTGGIDSFFTVVIGKDAKLSSAKLSGAVEISNSPTVNLGSPTLAAGSNVQATVTNASAQLVAADAARKYLLIQNNDTTADIYINFGAAATLSNGLKIKAGQSYELNCNILTAAVNAIGSVASNTNIVIVTG